MNAPCSQYIQHEQINIKMFTQKLVRSAHPNILYKRVNKSNLIKIAHAFAQNRRMFHWKGPGYVAQKSASRVKMRSSLVCLTLAFWYSPTLFSKKFVFPWREIISIHSKGFSTLKSLGTPTAKSRRSATNLMYWPIKREFMPISSTGRESETNSSSISTASAIIC